MMPQRSLRTVLRLAATLPMAGCASAFPSASMPTTLAPTPVADARMWDYHWPNAPLTQGPILDGIRALGVDVSTWDPAAAS